MYLITGRPEFRIRMVYHACYNETNRKTNRKNPQGARCHANFMVLVSSTDRVPIFDRVIVIQTLALEHCRISKSQTQVNPDYNKLYCQGNKMCNAIITNDNS